MEYKKNFLWNILGAGANAFTSLLFIIIVTRINEIAYAGIFSYCFATACLFYCIAVYAGRIFQVTDTNKKVTDWDYIQNRIITCIIMIIIALFFSFFKPQHTIYKAIILTILCIYKVIEAFSESLYGIIQKKEQLYKAGISMFVKAILSIFVFFIIDLLTKNLIYSCLSIILVNLLVMFIYDFYNIKMLNIQKNKFNKISNNFIFLTGFFTFLLSFLAIYLINLPRYAINDLLSDNLQTIFGIIIMPATFMGLLGQFIIQPFLVKIKTLLISTSYDELLKLTFKLTFSIIILGFIVLLCAYFLGIPVLQILYGLNLYNYKLEFMIIIFGSIFYSMNIILSAILVAMRKTLSQVIIYIILSIIGTILSYILVQNLNIIGACITYFVIMFIITISFSMLVIKKLKFKNLWKLLSNLYIKYKELINYLIMGGLSTLVSLLVYYICVFTFLDPQNPFQLQIANILSWIFAVIFAYFTNMKYVFESKNIHKFKEATGFMGSRITTLLLDMLIMYLGVTLLNINNTFVKIISQILVIVGNYIISKFFVFKKN